MPSAAWFMSLPLINFNLTVWEVMKDIIDHIETLRKNANEHLHNEYQLKRMIASYLINLIFILSVAIEFYVQVNFILATL